MATAWGSEAQTFEHYVSEARKGSTASRRWVEMGEKMSQP